MKITTMNEAGISFDNGTRIKDVHGQDCCEHVYADWGQLKDTDAFEHNFPEKLKIEGVNNSGISIDGYFIPCYNEQNGYYSSNLQVVIKTPDGKTSKIDVSEFVEDRIY